MTVIKAKKMYRCVGGDGIPGGPFIYDLEEQLPNFCGDSKGQGAIVDIQTGKAVFSWNAALWQWEEVTQ